ncbi:bifunctional diguanylate cyclase/phosphodiesterase [Vibrio bivalvicida]|uniref:EAL domain-containing protein n=1 Tax=Vibrio bivalvicida TaxID=1276888 RepID=A0ABV4MHA6_9VIBR
MKLALSLKHLALIWLIGTSFAAATYLTVHHYETQKLNAQLEGQLNNQVQTLQQSLYTIKNLLYSTRAFLSHGNQPTPKQFEAYFSEQSIQLSTIQSVVWAPVVSINDVDKFEQVARKNGFLGFKIAPPLSSNGSKAWFLDNETLPVFYLSSSFEGSDYLGFRLESEDALVNAMSRSITTKRIGAVDFIKEGQLGANLVLPKFSNDGKLDGFIVAKVVFHELLGEIWQREVNSASSEIEVYTQPGHELAFESHINTKLIEEGPTTRLVSLTQNIQVPLFNQEWIVSVSKMDNSGSTALYSTASVLLIFLLTGTISIAANFYATRLKVSDQLIEEKTRTLEIQAVRDNLTGLRNRTALNREVENQLQLLRQASSCGFSILFIDLDRFKVINDSMGHLHGDKLLMEVASRLTSHCRDDDMSFRFGGDEFIICLPRLTSRGALTHICHRYAKVLSQPYVIEDQACHIGASIGISVVTDPNQTLAGILREADTAMYRAKNSSNEKVVFFHEQMFNQAKKRFTLEQELTGALAFKQLSLVYQPIYSTSSDTVVAFESLLRWNHPKLGFISPEEFIPVAEETGQIISIGDWVAQECCKIIDRLWHTRSAKHVPRFNINVSAKQFESEHIYHTLLHLLDKHNFPAHLIGIEITESMLLADECTATQLQRIKDLGVSLYLDDFGTGFSSLSVLNDYPVDALKVDRSFVSRIALGQHNADSLCQAIINMAHTIDLEVVAEGVETPEQLAFLTQHRCNFIQGYLKSKPLTVCGLESVLNSQTKVSA